MTVAGNLAAIQSQMRSVLATAGRQLGSVRLIAVSKGQPLEKIRAAVDAGQKDFAENYLQEALPKIAALPTSLVWHFIGDVQSNKTHLIAENFAWVHTLWRAKTVQRLNAHRPEKLGVLDVCVQVNIDNEPSKAGLRPEALPDFMELLFNQPRLRPRGLMVIPKPRKTQQQQLEVFLQVAELLNTIKRTYPSLDTLSMGMSQDFIAAIEAGSTLVRLGSSVFGARQKAPINDNLYPGGN